MAYTFKIVSDTGGAISGLNEVKNSVRGLAGEVATTANGIKKDFNDSFYDVSGSLKKLIGGFAAFEGIKSFFKLGTEMEQTNISFEVMLGNMDKAKQMIYDISQYAIVTPFTTKEISDGAKMLLNYGDAENNILPDLKLLGDVSGGNSEKFKNMTYGFAQIMATGRLMGQDLRQLIDAGFNPLQEMSKKTGKSMADLKKDMEDGLISSKMVRDAFISATSEGGRFYGMMKKQSQTVGGLWSTFVDTVQLRLIKLFNQLAPVIKQSISLFTEISDIAMPVLNVLGDLLLNIIDLFKKLWPVLKYVVDLLLIMAAIKAFDFLVTGAISFFNTLIKLPSLITTIGAGLNSWTIALLGVAASALLIQDLFNQLKSGGSKEYGEKLAKPYKEELDKLQYAKNQDSTSMARQKELKDTIASLQGNGVMPITSLVARVTENIKNLFKGIYENLPNHGGVGQGIISPNSGGGVTGAAIDTSNLSGASGGLGEAKIIHMHFNKALVENNIPGGNGLDILAKSPTAAEMILRILNNIAPSQGATM